MSVFFFGLDSSDGNTHSIFYPPLSFVGWCRQFSPLSSPSIIYRLASTVLFFSLSLSRSLQMYIVYQVPIGTRLFLSLKCSDISLPIIERGREKSQSGFVFLWAVVPFFSVAIRRISLSLAPWVYIVAVWIYSPHYRRSLFGIVLYLSSNKNHACLSSWTRFFTSKLDS